MSQHVMEIVRFRPVAGVEPATLVQAARDAEVWIRAQPGFVSRRLGRSDDGAWVDWIEWTDMTSARSAGSRIMETPATAAFLSSIDMTSIDMRHCTIELAG